MQKVQWNGNNMGEVIDFLENTEPKIFARADFAKKPIEVEGTGSDGVFKVRKDEYICFSPEEGLHKKANI